jgi:hypothetical protein
MAITVDYEPARKRGKYPWSEWEDGQVWLVVRGRDYKCGNDSFRRSLTMRAQKSGKKLDVEVFDPFPIELLQRAGIGPGYQTTGGMVFRFTAPAKRKLRRKPWNEKCGDNGIRHVWRPAGSINRLCQCGAVMWKNAGK